MLWISKSAKMKKIFFSFYKFLSFLKMIHSKYFSKLRNEKFNLNEKFIKAVENNFKSYSIEI